VDHQPSLPQPPFGRPTSGPTPGAALGPVSGADPARDPDDPLWGAALDWIDDAEWQRLCADRAARGDDGDEEPVDPVEAFYDDPDSGPPPDWEQPSLEELTAQAEADGAEDAALMARLVAAGVDGYAHDRSSPPRPGVAAGPAAGFGQGCPLDAGAPSTLLSGLADEASGESRSFAGVTDDGLMGLLGTRQRLACRQQWELITAVAEFIRRRPQPGCPPEEPGNMPRVWHEHAAGELSGQLHITKHHATDLLDLAHDLTVKLPLTAAALRDGIIDLDKARIIALHCSDLTRAEALVAEKILLGQDTVEEMTWGMIRYRIALAVMEVNPDAARRRRERAEQERRVEVRPELSGNALLSGRELPPAAVLAASERLTARALELREAGVDGGLDELRAMAYLEAFGVLDPLQNIHPGDGDGTGTSDPASDSGTGARPWPAPVGFAAKVNLTIPLTTLLGTTDRPGILSGTGPIDADLARDLAAAAARDPRSTWCVTVTGPDSRPVAHGCGRPPTRRPRTSPRHHTTPGPNHTPEPGHPEGPARDGPARDGPACTPADDRSPPGTGTLRLNPGALTGDGTGKDLEFTLESLAGPCDHAHQAAGHDPGVRLRHLTAILNSSCTFSTCRRPERTCDYEHSTPYEQGGRTCLCDAGPVCRHDHRAKQSPGWRLEQAGQRGWFRWTTPSGRTYLSRPTQYPDLSGATRKPPVRTALRQHAAQAGPDRGDPRPRDTGC
jgi:hypothetical protein